MPDVFKATARQAVEAPLPGAGVQRKQPDAAVADPDPTGFGPAAMVAVGTRGRGTGDPGTPW
ncbi:hypothetical protein GCM10023084_25240 [Streptomyces lacrimifluminis]|uniref:Uncharacterized protein n=1 Tax=Streptomyces lacrimifluminis TaxID=1500077 RepID=A0A917KJX7_9ACTN|nr:hypothetical protein GCM10012282_08010 [Streptomyces lacrimifluminis]